MSSINVEDREDSESCTSNSSFDSCKDVETDVLHVEETNSKPHESPRNQINMYMICRELCFLLLIVVAYATLQNHTPKISKSPNAFPFFPKGSIVKDWYRGQLSEAIELASESDIAFVMYYAPWDAESQAVKHEFNIVAQHMYKYVHFAAINCWQPGSECRQQYNKVYSWPVLMAYPTHGRGIQYRGPRKVEHMLRFLQCIINPLTRINNDIELIEYQVKNDAIVVGYMNAELGNSDYVTFYSTALRFLERDPFREVPFLIMTGNNELTDLPALNLYLWNETLIYPSTNEWQSDPIISWISDNLHQVSVWASPPGGKSQSLSNYLLPGPALILFTPRNPLYPQIDYYTILHAVALDYYNCYNDLKINMRMSLIGLKRNAYYRAYNKMKTKCLSTKNKKPIFPTVVTYDIPKIWLNNTCDKLNQKCKKTCSTPVILNKEFYTDSKTSKDDPDPIENSAENDFYSPASLLKLSETEQCHYFRLAHRLQPAHFAPVYGQHINNVSVTGFSCKTNQSLAIIALDSIQHHHFAEGLGIDILNKPDKSAVVIINPNLETHHVMETKYSTANLQRFIYDFTNGALERMLSSSAIPKQHTHYYQHHDFCHVNHSRDFCLTELTTSTFLPTVMKQNMAVVVMYYSVKCAFCSGISHTLLTTARLLAQVKDIHFTRIDGDSHNVPWEYTMHHYPSILFFPAKRKEESRIFPQTVPITVPNILSFILANVEPNIKLKTMWSLCKQNKFNEDFENCIKSIRIECMKQIGRLLRVYRFSSRQERPKLLKPLQVIRYLYILLATSSNTTEIQKQITQLRSFPSSKHLHTTTNL